LNPENNLNLLNFNKTAGLRLLLLLRKSWLTPALAFAQEQKQKHKQKQK
jgi:hypothetical protein